MKMSRLGILMVLCLQSIVFSGAQSASPANKPVTVGPLQIARQGILFVGGAYDDPAAPKTMTGQAYVQYQIPVSKGKPKYPVVMIHGAFQTGANFLGTPDGRPGWADYFLSKGWPVYVMDRPGHGKSGSAAGSAAMSGPPPMMPGMQPPPGAMPPNAAAPAGAPPGVPPGAPGGAGGAAPAMMPGAPAPGMLQTGMTAPELNPTYPQAALHTQWPGGMGVVGNPAFDQFYASEVANQPEALAYRQTVKATVELIKKIGPVVLLTHSMSGPMGWMIADAVEPGMVKAIIAAEPAGPNGPAGRRALPWGIAPLPLNYSPAVNTPDELGLTEQASEGLGLLGCQLQKEPAHQLPKLAKVPVVVVTGEASTHAQYDHCMVRYLNQAGVKSEYMDLGKLGLHGNGHMMMLESNSLEIAARLESWLSQTVKN